MRRNSIEEMFDEDDWGDDFQVKRKGSFRKERQNRRREKLQSIESEENERDY